MLLGLPYLKRMDDETAGDYPAQRQLAIQQRGNRAEIYQPPRRALLVSESYTLYNKNQDKAQGTG